MRIKGKVEKEVNRTLRIAYIELSDVELSNPHVNRGFMYDRPDERELVKELKQVKDLRIYSCFANFKVEIDDIIEAEGTLELVDNMWFFNCQKLINVQESSSHDERLFARFRQLSHATPVARW